MAASTHRASVAQVRGPHLIVEALGEELVIYDRHTNKAHLLDPRAVAIWNAAEKGCSMDDLAGVVEGDTIEDRTRVAQLAVAELERAGLLQSEVPALERRQLLKSLGTMAALPMVVSILAPTSAAAASNVLPGDPCIQFVDSCQTPIFGVPFLCQDPDGMGPKIGRCCPDQPTRTDTLLDGQFCSFHEECCSFVCDMMAGKCLGDFLPPPPPPA